MRGWATENDQFPNRDRPKASPLASPQQPMDHVFLRGQIHQKLFGRSPRAHDSAIRFYRHRRAADPSSFFKSLLCGRILFGMMRPRLQLGEFQLPQPFADRALGNGDREAPGYLRAQIDAAPADNFVDIRIRPGDDQFAQFSHLRLGQFGGRTRCLARHQAVDAGLIVAMNPVAQGLTVHARLTRGVEP